MSAPCSAYDDPSCGLLGFRQSRSGELINWSKKISANYSAGKSGCTRPPGEQAVDFFWSIRFNWGPIRVGLARETDEEARICNSLGGVAGMGANEIGTQGGGRAGRQLRAHRSHGGRQAGLFDEVRQFAGPAATAAGGSPGRARSRAGGAKNRHFRLVL
jgi:hypothetical protein